ncbi:MAG: hypothetical protein U1F54_15775 [Burkholderiales bacterium]
MKSLIAALCLSATFAASAQGVTASTDDATTPARATGDTPSSRDPRACLEFPTREQVIACAEKFRPHRAPKKS